MPHHRSALAKLPARCFAQLPSTGETIVIVRGESGYRPIDSVCPPEMLNAALPEPPTPEQVQAMLIGSMFGWDVPGADPDVLRGTRSSDQASAASGRQAESERTADGE